MGYPTYYTVPFHAYGEGNLGWLPAFECESATMSMALRVWKAEAEVRPLQPQSGGWWTLPCRRSSVLLFSCAFGLRGRKDVKETICVRIPTLRHPSVFLVFLVPKIFLLTRISHESVLYYGIFSLGSRIPGIPQHYHTNITPCTVS